MSKIYLTNNNRTHDIFAVIKMDWRWKTQRVVDVESGRFAFFGCLWIFVSQDEILMRAKKEKHEFKFLIEEIVEL